MKSYIYPCSESVVLSLCKEIEYIKSRSKNINYSLMTCQNKNLYLRLKTELENLNKNLFHISNISKSLLNIKKSDISFEFLFELARRSNAFQQI